MQYNAVAGNPFAVLTAIVAPAIFTNASSVLALGTSNRLARVVDRTRIVSAKLADLEPGTADYQAWSAQLAPLQMRTQFLVKALRHFYAGLGLFAASALVSVSGSIGAYYGQAVFFRAAATLAVLTGASAVFGLCARLCADGSRNAARRKILRGGSENASGSAQSAASSALAAKSLRRKLTPRALR